jgi:bifunctional non-homologous end joining protein LigD
MSRVVKCLVSQAVKSGPSRGGKKGSPLPAFIPPQLSQPVEKAPSGPQWLHEIKLDGFRMAARERRLVDDPWTKSGILSTARISRWSLRIGKVA